MEKVINGYTISIDDCDNDLLVIEWRIKLHDGTHRYAIKNQKKYPNLIYLHREILSRMIGRPLTRFEYTDHIDGNSLNNNRSNLRLATPMQNTVNSKLSSRNTSGFKGVTWNKRCKKWQSSIKFNGKSQHLGLFDTPIAAHEAYITKARELFGEFARAA